jgi:hemerythrin
MPPIILPSDISSGVAAMDDLHRDFVYNLMSVSATSDEFFPSHYGAFVKKTEETFAQEEKWMEEIKFPVIKSHREQHALVLGALHKVHSRVLAGDISTGREVVNNLLPQWFLMHTSMTDRILASAMKTVRDPRINILSPSYAT